jgi:hypothetical protein
MSPRQRSWVIAAALMVLGGLGAWLLRPGETRLNVGPEHAVFGLLRTDAAQAAGSSRAVRSLLAQVAPPPTRNGLRTALLRADAAELHLGFGFAEPAFAVVPGDAPRPATPAVLPRVARELLDATPGGYLVVRTERPADLVATGRRRAWFGAEVAGIATRARAVTVAVGEGGFPRQVVAVFYFEYESGEAAAAALRSLTTAKPGGEAAFIVPDGAPDAARRHAVVTLRYEVAALLVEQAAAGR